MPATSLVDKLAADFSQFEFKAGDTFHWSPQDQTVVYASLDDDLQLLHELGHALLGHADYTRDIQLIEMEQQAWAKARQIAPDYDVSVDQDRIEESLDSYRDWLHARSTCPNCQATGVQRDSHHYRCISCLTVWRVNDARLCELRRYVTKPKRSQ